MSDDQATWPITIIFEDGTEKICDAIHDVPIGRPYRRKGERGPDDAGWVVAARMGGGNSDGV